MKQPPKGPKGNVQGQTEQSMGDQQSVNIWTYQPDHSAEGPSTQTMENDSRTKLTLVNKITREKGEGPQSEDMGYGPDDMVHIVKASGDSGKVKITHQVSRAEIEHYYTQVKAAEYSPDIFSEFQTLLDLAIFQERTRKLPELAEVVKAEAAHKEALAKVKPEVEGEEIVINLKNIAKELDKLAAPEKASKAAEAALTAAKAKLVTAIKSTDADPAKSPVAEFIKSQIFSPDGKTIVDKNLFLHMQKKYQEHRSTEPNPYAISGKSIVQHALESGATIDNQHLVQFLNANNITVDSLNVYEWMQSQYDSAIKAYEAAKTRHDDALDVLEDANPRLQDAVKEFDAVSSIFEKADKEITDLRIDGMQYLDAKLAYDEAAQALQNLGDQENRYVRAKENYASLKSSFDEATEEAHGQAKQELDDAMKDLKLANSPEKLAYDAAKARYDDAIKSLANPDLKKKYDTTKRKYDVAKEDYDLARKEYESAKSDHEKATMERDSAKAALDEAPIILKKAQSAYSLEERTSFKYLYDHPDIMVSGKPAIAWLIEKNAIIDKKPVAEMAIEDGIKIDANSFLKYLIDNNILIQNEPAVAWAQRNFLMAEDDAASNKYKIDNQEPLEYLFQGFKDGAKPEAREAAIDICRESFILGKFALEEAVEKGIKIEGKPILQYFIDNNLTILHEPAAVWAQRIFAITNSENYKIKIKTEEGTVIQEPLEYAVLKELETATKKELESNTLKGEEATKALEASETIRKAAIELFRDAVVNKRIPCNGTKVVLALQDKFDKAHTKTDHTFIPTSPGTVVFIPPILEILQFDNVKIDIVKVKIDQPDLISTTWQDFYNSNEERENDKLSEQDIRKLRDNVLRWAAINIPAALISNEGIDAVIKNHKKLEQQGSLSSQQQGKPTALPSNQKLAELGRQIQHLQQQKREAFQRASEEAARQNVKRRQKLQAQREAIAETISNLYDEIRDLEKRGDEADDKSAKLKGQLKEIRELKAKQSPIQTNILAELKLQLQALEHEKRTLESAPVQPTKESTPVQSSGIWEKGKAAGKAALQKTTVAIQKTTKTDELSKLEKKIQLRQAQIAAIESGLDTFQIKRAEYDGKKLEEFWKSLESRRKELQVLEKRYGKEPALEASIKTLEDVMESCSVGIQEREERIGKEVKDKNDKIIAKRRGLSLELQTVSVDELSLEERALKELHATPLYSLEDEGKPKDQRVPLDKQIAALEKQIDQIYAEDLATVRADLAADDRIALMSSLGGMHPIDYMIKLARIKDGIEKAPTDREGQILQGFEQEYIDKYIEKPVLIDEVDPRLYAVIHRHIKVVEFMDKMHDPRKSPQANYKALLDILPEDRISTYGLDALNSLIKTQKAEARANIPIVSQRMAELKEEFTSTMKSISRGKDEIREIEIRIRKVDPNNKEELEALSKVRSAKYEAVEILNKKADGLKAQSEKLLVEKNQFKKLEAFEKGINEALQPEKAPLSEKAKNLAGKVKSGAEAFGHDAHGVVIGGGGDILKDIGKFAKRILGRGDDQGRGNQGGDGRTQ